MINQEYLKLLHSGVKQWNGWRDAHSRGQNLIIPDLSFAQLDGMDLRGYHLSRVNLWKARLRNAKLMKADLSYTELHWADLSNADLSQSKIQFAILSRATLSDAILYKADLRGTSLRRAILQGADLTGANLRHASLAEATVQGATFKRAQVYGAGVWGLVGKPANQQGLILQAKEESSPITVDNLETAQLLFLLLENPKIANVIEAASRQIVLILGRFTPARKRILEKIKERLLRYNLVPVLFDFPKPGGRDLTETVASLAHMSCFIIADLTDAKSIPQELSYIVPYLPSVPVVPLILESERTYAMFEHFMRYQWVQPAVRYKDVNHLLSIFDEVVRVGYREALRCQGNPTAKLPKFAKKKAADLKDK